MHWLTNTLQFGRFSAPVWLVAAVASLFGGLIVASVMLHGDSKQRKKAQDILVNFFLIFLVVWKISPALFELQRTLQNPLMLLYLPGGPVGTIAGLMAAALYLTFTYIKNRPIPILLLRTIIVSMVASVLLFAGVAGLAAGQLTGGGDEVAVARNQAPDFELTTLDGATERLADYRGRYVVLNFWASWCPPCKAEIPELVEYSNRLEAGGPILLSVNQITSENSIESVRSFVDKYGIEFPVLLDRGNRVHTLYGIRGIPTTFIIGPDGNIVSKRTGAVTGSWLLSTTR